MGCGITTVKYLLFIFNLLFAVSSLLWRPITSNKNQYDWQWNEANSQARVLGEVIGLAAVQESERMLAGCFHFVTVGTSGLLFCIGKCRWRWGWVGGHVYKTYLCFVKEVGDEIHSSKRAVPSRVSDGYARNDYFKLSRVRMCACVLRFWAMCCVDYTASHTGSP
jgi:hypothetical protein